MVFTTNEIERIRRVLGAVVNDVGPAGDLEDLLDRGHVQRLGPEPKTPRRRHGAIVALAAFLSVALVGGALSLIVLSDDEHGASTSFGATVADTVSAEDLAAQTEEEIRRAEEIRRQAEERAAAAAAAAESRTTMTGAPPLSTEAPAWDDSGGDFYDWATVADGPDGVRTTGAEHQLLGVRRVLATVQETVPAIQDATVLMFGSTEFFEEGFFVMEDGSDTMIYIGWADLVASVGSQTDPHDIVKLPIADDMVTVTEQWGDVTVTRRITDTVADFVVETPQALVTVRFFALDNHYGFKTIASSPDEMIEIARGIFDAIEVAAAD